MSSILLGLVYLAVVLVIFWSVYAERIPSYRDRGPFILRRVPGTPETGKPEPKSSKKR